MNKTYWDVYRRLHGDFVPPKRTEWLLSNADIFCVARGFVAAFNFTCQLLTGCPGGCLFCYVPLGGPFVHSDVRGPNGRLWSFRVKTKRRIEEQLRKYLETNRLCDKTIYFSGVTDNYASSPSITRLFWRTLLAAPQCPRPRRIAIQTRFRPDRDVERIAEYNRKTTTSDGAPPVVVNYSLGTDDNAIIRKFERATPSFEQRLACIKKLRAHDVFVSATLSPFAFKDARETLHRLHDLGVPFVSVLFFKIRTNSANTPPLFIKYLESEHPHLLDLSWQADRLDEMREIYGESRVLEGQTGFSALTIPHLVGTCPPDQLDEVAMQMKNE